MPEEPGTARDDGGAAAGGGEPAERVEPAEPVELPIEMEEYLTWLRLERGRAASTVEAYRRDLRVWASHLRSIGRDVGEVTEDDLVAWVGQLRSGGLADATVKRRVVAARNLHRYRAEEGLADSDIGRDVAPPPTAKGLPKALTEDDIDRLLAASSPGAAGLRDQAILEVLYGTGIRISELQGMSLGDLDLHEGFLRVLGKGDKERLVPLIGEAAEALARWLDPDVRGTFTPARWRSRDDEDAVFLSQRGRRLSRQGIWLVVRARAERVGLQDRLTPHVLRHSCATHLLDRGADIRAVQELLGHASIGTTQIYTKVATERLVATWRAAHPRAGHP